MGAVTRMLSTSRATQHALLHVEDLDVEVGQRAEEGGGHSWAVGPGDDEEQGGRSAVMATTGYRPSSDDDAATSAARAARSSGCSAAARWATWETETAPPSSARAIATMLLARSASRASRADCAEANGEQVVEGRRPVGA